MREALPKTTALSVLVRDQVTADANDGGVTLALLTEHFDRIYVDTDTVDAAALQGLLPADFDPVTRLVQVAAEARLLRQLCHPLNFPVAKREKL